MENGNKEADLLLYIYIYIYISDVTKGSDRGLPGGQRVDKRCIAL